MVVIWLDEASRTPAIPPSHQHPFTPGLEQRSPAACCINEQAALKGTGSCNADEWSLQSRDERRSSRREAGGEDGGLKGVLVGEGGQVGTRGAAAGGEKWGGGFNFHLGVL